MADAAAFFANKKKKKAFKFNANLVDATSVTSTLHFSSIAGSQDSALVDGHASSDLNKGSTNNGAVDSGEMWDDEALAATLSTGKKPTNVVPSSTTGGATIEVLDMKSMDPKRHDQGNIAKRMAVEETKAKLAAAREGMEREAAKRKEEKERKETEKQQAVGSASSRFGAAAAAARAGGGGTPGAAKWLPPQLRAGGVGANAASLGAGGGSIASRVARNTGGPGSQKFDVENEELFPDLADADKILKDKEQQPAFRMLKKTPVGGGATWASKSTKSPAPEPPITSTTATKADTPKQQQQPQPLQESSPPPPPAPPLPPQTTVSASTNDEPVKGAPEATQPKPSVAVAPPPAPASPSKASTSSSAAAAGALAAKKKKKKDLSTFNPTAK